MSQTGKYNPLKITNMDKYSKWKNEIDKITNKGKISDEKRNQLRKKRKKRHNNR